MVLGRALLKCRSLDDAVALLADGPHCGGFHMTLAQSGDPRLLSVEFGAGVCAIRRIDRAMLHANHALHLNVPQIVTRSSRDRQAKDQALRAMQTPDPLAILRSTQGPGLPVFRTNPDDPDFENTLATALLELHPDHIALTVLDQSGARLSLRVDQSAKA